MDTRPVWQKLLGSRKVWVAFSGVVAQIGGRYGLKIDQEVINAILALHGLVILAIGWEDAAEKRDVPPPR